MTTQSLHDKLVQIQSELKAPKGQYNKFGEYYYRSCEDIQEALKPLLLARGLTLTISDAVVAVGNYNYIQATVKLSDGTDTIEVSAFARETWERPKFDSSQLTGSASSYARKYALNGLFCIDDTKDADTQEPPNKTNHAALSNISGPVQTDKTNDQLVAEANAVFNTKPKLGFSPKQ